MFVSYTFFETLSTSGDGLTRVCFNLPVAMDALDRETEIPRETARGKERERGRCHAGAKSHEVGAESQHKVNRRSYWRESHQVCANVGMGVCGCMWVCVCVCGCGCVCVCVGVGL